MKNPGKELLMISEKLLKNEEKAIFRLRDLYRRYGYTQYKMSKFEEYDLYVKNKNFLVSDNVITFTDTDGKLMALKPDVTLSIVKNSREMPGGVRKVYYNENVYRPAGGSRAYREIMQTGLECLGDVDDYCVSEVLSLAVSSLAAIADDYQLDVSHLGILSEVLARSGVPQETGSEILACMGEKNKHGVIALCREAGIGENETGKITALMNCTGEAKEAIAVLRSLYADEAWLSLIDSFEAILSLLPTKRVSVDFSVVNDMNYYNGIVFHGFVNGVPTGILSGGQYDNLMKKMGKNMGAIGFAVYLDQLEMLAPSPGEYDADTLLLYDEKTDLSLLTGQARALAEEGKSVLALKMIPEKAVFRRTVDLRKGENEA